MIASSMRFLPRAQPLGILPLGILVLLLQWSSPLEAQVYSLSPAPSAVDNPLKGLVPYARPFPDRFPHSMEFNYLALSQLMKGDDQFDWEPLEELLNDIASRGNQSVVRIFLEYPGKKEGIPQFLIDGGLTVHRYLNTNTAPFPPTEVATPNYEDPQLRAALRRFIAAWGAKYDGDPRIGYITAGLLGTWGEWHTYPRNDLWASKEVQTEVMEAYEKAFHRTPVLLRTPANSNHYSHAENASRSFGYHDDSFAWATIDTRRKEDQWFFVPSIKSAGPMAVNKWQKYPIGGEIRPELWGKIFDDPSQWPKEAQDFRDCVDQTHATWLMDTGMFREVPSDARREKASQEVRHMGYDFQVMQAQFAVSKPKMVPHQLLVTVEIKNQGVAPFYADWPTELALLNAENKIQQVFTAEELAMRKFFPSKNPISERQAISLEHIPVGKYTVLLRVANPLPNGKPLRFANQEQDRDLAGWLSLGSFEFNAK